jgi:sulfite exporter TauE/SafE
MTALFGALALGIVGSGHCVAMCGPLVVAFSRTAGRDPRRQTAQALLYHTGRIAMYGVLGSAAGQAAYRLAIAGLGRPLAIGVGIVLALAALGRMTMRRPGG